MFDSNNGLAIWLIGLVLAGVATPPTQAESMISIKRTEGGVELIEIVNRVKRQTSMSFSNGADKQDTSKRGFTATEKIALVRKHNSLRAIVQPTASNMRYMVKIYNSNQITLFRIIIHKRISKNQCLSHHTFK